MIHQIILVFMRKVISSIRSTDHANKSKRLRVMILDQFNLANMVAVGVGRTSGIDGVS